MVDSETLHILTGKLIISTLLFFRILGFLTSGPFFKSSTFPPQVKIFLGVLMAVSMTTPFWQEQPQIELHLWYTVLLVMKEFLVGIAIGFSANAVFWGARMAGGLIDFDMGYHTASVFNIDENSPTIIGELQYMVMVLIFLMINGHHLLIEALYASVQAVPITVFTITESTVLLFVKMATTVLLVGIKMSAPLLIAIFLTNLALALLARVAPQTNVFVLSFQVKIAVGLLVLLASVSLFVFVSKMSLAGVQEELMRFILSLNPDRA
jgi:flagellar biosynthesis protein FliR